MEGESYNEFKQSVMNDIREMRGLILLRTPGIYFLLFIHFHSFLSSSFPHFLTLLPSLFIMHFIHYIVYFKFSSLLLFPLFLSSLFPLTREFFY